MARFKTDHKRHRATDNKRATQQKDPTTWVGALGVIALVATLVPLLLISAYNHSYADDWHYGVWAHLALEDGANIFQVIWVALEQAGKAWLDWQGTYSAIFVMALEPNVFGEQFYVLAAPLVLLTLLAGTFFFAHVMLCELMGAPRGVWLGLSSLLVVVELLLQPSPVEGIFWFNSAVYYTTYNAAALATLGCLGRICDPARERAPRGTMVVYCALALFVAGGNYVTALVLFEVMAVAMVLLWRSQRRCTYEALIGFMLLVFGLVVSFVAPGNSVRQATQFPEDSAGVLGTIWGSSLACFQYIQEWSSGLVVLLALASVGVALYVCPRAIERGMQFRWPAAVVVGSIALFATSFTPTFWAEGSVGPGRVQNCRLDIFLLLLVVNIFWVVGWIEGRRLAAGAQRGFDDAASVAVQTAFGQPASQAASAQPVFPAASSQQACQAELGQSAFQTAPKQQISQVASSQPTSQTAPSQPTAVHPTTYSALISARHVCVWFGLVMLVFACTVGTMAASEDLGEKLSSVSAARSLISGKAEDYHEQVLKRLNYIESSSESELEVEFYHNIPHVLWMGDIRDNMDNYINYRLCQWYGKDSIIGVSSVSGSSDE